MANASVRDVTLSIPSSMSKGFGWLMVIGDDERAIFSTSLALGAGGASKVTNDNKRREIYRYNSDIYNAFDFVLGGGEGLVVRASDSGLRKSGADP
jgi:hypothetical protein